MSNPSSKMLLENLYYSLSGNSRKQWHFSNKNSKKQNIRKRINAIVSLFGTTTIQDFKKVANEFITQLNRSCHFSSIAELKTQIEEALRAFVAYPELLVSMNVEHIILQSFNEIETKILTIPLE